ncbi:MAG: aminotransferase class IV [bacterium]|nr:aminotransferase class IV [bacterium]
MNGYVYHNGLILPASEAGIPVFSPGFLYGEGLFETLRVYGGHPFRLDDHLRRLRVSARTLGIRIRENNFRIAEAIQDLICLNNLSEARVRITLIPGPDSHPGANKKQNPGELVITVIPYSPPRWMSKSGVSAVISAIRRNSFSPLPRWKNLNYLENRLAREEARTRNADEAIFLDQSGFVAEGAMTNVFLVGKSALFTPPTQSPILPGITREIVMELAREQGIPCREKKLRPSDLYRAGEVFLTNSLIEVAPVIKIEGKKIGSGIPGPITKIIQRAYHELLQRNINKKTNS